MNLPNFIGVYLFAAWAVCGFFVIGSEKRFKRRFFPWMALGLGGLFSFFALSTIFGWSA